MNLGLIGTVLVIAAIGLAMDYQHTAAQVVGVIAGIFVLAAMVGGSGFGRWIVVGALLVGGLVAFDYVRTVIA